MAIRALVDETLRDERGRPCRMTGGEFPEENRASLSMRFDDGSWCSLEIEASRLDAATIDAVARGWARDPDYRAHFMTPGSHSFVGRDLLLPQDREHEEEERLMQAERLAARREALELVLARGEAATFEEYAALRSGSDEFSGRRLSRLRTDLGDLGEEVATLGAALSDKALASALRWCARGLPPLQAVRRAEVETEVERMAAEDRNSRWRR
ncbi:hypothetical protein GCM10008955_31680 [Deinococcus malanensis]|uniref:Uncharacterized protein n=2 Tax=Deinococcus malanensis TaxID=1706855 RepID=A0ABQ2F2V6_9DEIO|nr:hypothetical protein GCM10008955_31680 [Deinococcus malanensis]